MKQFLKDNPTLAFGLGLPVLLVVIFSIAAGLPSLTATPPKYDVLFANNYYEHANDGFRVRVAEGKLRVTFVGDCNYCQPLELYRYNAATETVKRISIDPPAESRPPKNANNTYSYSEANRNRVLPVDVGDLATLKLSDSQPAPDGYEFTQSDGYSSSGILPSLFFSRSYYNNNEPVLRNGSYRLRLPLERNNYSYYNTRFIGWVVAP